MIYRHLALRLLFVFLLLVCGLSLTATAQQNSRRDYMTDEEIELVRDAQDIDDRIDVLTKMIDRRFTVLKLDVGGPAIAAKESGRWGSLPTGSNMQLYDDIRKLLQKAIDDIDNVAAHPIDYNADKQRSEKQKKKDAERFPGAVRNLAAAARRYQPALKTLADRVTDEREKGAILGSLQSCDEIIEAVGKLPPE